MRILWLSMNSGLYQDINKPNASYNGGGWISSLQKLVEAAEENVLALAFISHTPLKKIVQNRTVYYPIYEKASNKIQKIIQYHGGYKHINSKKYLSQINDVIEDFKPDIIHLFGLENQLSSVLEQHKVPVVVHLQGLLAPYDNAFFPVDFNKSSFLFPFTVREWIYRNGYIFAKNSIHVRGKREYDLFKKMRYAMGRTEWDYQISQLLSKDSLYFHVDEILRDPFYLNAGKWECPNTSEFKIVSTISNTIYKGLDLILKAACLLKKQTDINFKWQVIGISNQDAIVRFFERKLKINSSEVGVEYLGVLKENDLCDALLDSHMYVHPSYIDNSPNSLCEAQLLGMPVIGTFVGGIPSLINHNETGILVPANAPFELAYYLKTCYIEKENMKRMGRMAYLTACQRHNKNRVLRSLLDTYLNVLQKNK